MEEKKHIKNILKDFVRNYQDPGQVKHSGLPGPAQLAEADRIADANAALVERSVTMVLSYAPTSDAEEVRMVLQNVAENQIEQIGGLDQYLEQYADLILKS